MTGRLYPADAVAGAPEYSGRALRQTLAPLVPGATSARPLGGQSGVRPGTPSTTVSVSGSTWTVTPHAGILDLESSALAGPYSYSFDANVTGSINSPHSTLTRWDGIYVQLSDPAESDGTSTPGVAIVYAAGTAAASPAMPTTPARSMVLARIVVPPSGGGSATAVWLAPLLLRSPAIFTSLGDLNARHPAPNTDARAVIGTGDFRYNGSSWVSVQTPTFATTSALPASGDFVGQLAYTADYGAHWRWTGTRWAPIDPRFASTAARDAAITSPAEGDTCRIGLAVWYRTSSAWVMQQATGSVTVTVTASASGTATITFPTGAFASAPQLFLQKESANLAKYVPYISSVSATTAGIGLYSGDGSTASGSTAVSWLAVAQ